MGQRRRQNMFPAVGIEHMLSTAAKSEGEKRALLKGGKTIELEVGS